MKTLRFVMSIFLHVTIFYLLFANVSYSASYTITSSANSGGTIIPKGKIVVPVGGSQAFIIAPDSAHYIADVKVDKVSVGAVMTYTFNNVSAKHTIKASFEIKTYTVTSSSGANGKISPTGSFTVKHGLSKSFTAIPSKGYKAAIKVDGKVVIEGTLPNKSVKYKLSKITANHTVEGVFFTEEPNVTYRIYGLNFSPYIDEQDPNLGSQINEEQLRARMDIIAPYTQWIRTFGSSSGLEKAGLAAHDIGLKAASGAWLSSNLSANEQEISNLISVAKAGQVDLAIVGSEVLLRGDLTEGQLIDYINRVKQEVPGIPVTTADVYSEILSHPLVIAVCDVILVNYYPYWEGIKVDEAIASIHGWHQQVTAAGGRKTVIVSETGWPSGGNQVGNAVPSPENASFYFLNFVSWARANNVPYFYFEAFDESWKATYEGPQGAHWGIWDKDGILKPGMQDVFDGKTMPDNWSGNSIPGGPGNPTIEFTYVPPYGSFENLRGQIWHVKPADYKVAVYIYVSGWWTKPYFSSPLTTIQNDGSWTCDITTDGADQNATGIAAYLVTSGYNPPLMSGGSTLPSELDQNSVAKVETTRAL